MLIKVKKKFLSIICLFFFLIITGDVFAESIKDDHFILNARKIINKNNSIINKVIAYSLKFLSFQINKIHKKINKLLNTKK